MNLELKSKIQHVLIEYIQKELQLASESLASSRDLLTQDDMRPEGKYDTRRTEVGYLIQAQGKRVEELKRDLEVLSNFIPILTQKVEVGSLVQISNLEEEIERLYFICPTLVGVSLEIENQKINVISFQSPLAQECITLSKDDYFEMQSPKGDCEYKIIELI